MASSIPSDWLSDILFCTASFDLLLECYQKHKVLFGSVPCQMLLFVLNLRLFGSGMPAVFAFWNYVSPVQILLMSAHLSSGSMPVSFVS